MPKVLITLVISITPTVQADSVCDVPASNNWNVDTRVNHHYLNPTNSWIPGFADIDGFEDGENEEIFQQISI